MNKKIINHGINNNIFILYSALYANLSRELCNSLRTIYLSTCLTDFLRTSTALYLSQIYIRCIRFSLIYIRCVSFSLIYIRCQIYIRCISVSQIYIQYVRFLSYCIYCLCMFLVLFFFKHQGGALPNFEVPVPVPVL